MGIGTKLLGTMLLVMLITAFCGFAGSISGNKKVCEIAAIALFVEILILIIGIIISIWI